MTIKLRSQEVSWREVEGEAVVLDMRSSTYFQANRSATVLLKALVDGAEHQQLVDRLVTAYGLAPEQAAADVGWFLSELERRGLLEDAR